MIQPHKPWKLILYVSVLLSVYCCSCNLGKRHLSDEEVKVLQKAHNDSLTVVLDSFYRMQVYIPPLYDSTTGDSAVLNNFFELAKATQGELKILVNAQAITQEIVNIIQSYSVDDCDLLFLIDKTGSMSDDIANVQKGLSQIIDALQAHKNIRLGVALYGDKNSDGKDWFSFRNFEKDYTAVKQFINGIQVTEGGDYPESIYDGFFRSCEEGFWKSSRKRMVLLIGDAPSLEKPFSDFSLSDVIKKATENNMTMNFYPIVVMPSNEFIYFESGEMKKMQTYESSRLVAALYPNPSPGTVTVDFDKYDTYSIQVYNNTGTLVLSDNVSGNRWRKDLSGLPNGTYVVRAITKDKKYEATRFVLMK